MAHTYVHIPEELLVKIFLPQPFKSLVQWRCVCKLWNQVIRSKSFIKSYGAYQKTSTDIKHLFDLLTCPDRRIVKVALQGLENLLKVGEAEKNLGDIKSTDIKLLCDLLTCPDLRIVKVALQGLENLLKVGEAEKNLGDENVYLQLLAEADGGLEKIENLLRHDDYEVYKKAVLLLDMYWLDDAD